VSLNPYASGEAALPATEPVPRGYYKSSHLD
jgi:hypothetical protein